jgi:hypothetical protein
MGAIQADRDGDGDSKGSGEWSGDEFDGIRSHADFRRAMALEAERLRGTWGQRVLRALSTMGANLWNSRALRLFRLRLLR